MIQDFFDGLTSYGSAFRHVSRYGLWGYVLLPGLLCLLLGGGMLWLSFGLSDNVGNLIDDLWRWEWGKEAAGKVARMFGGLLVLVLGLLILKQLLMVVAAPFMSILSEKVENQLMGKDNVASLTLRQILSDIWRGLRIAVRNLVRELILTIFLLLLGLIPVLTPFTTALIFIIQAYYAGFGNLDFALERHFRYAASVRFVRSYKGLAIGNGVGFLLLIFTFAGFLIALPLGTVAATIETIKRLK